MNGRITSYLKDNYTDVKSDLFSAFIVRNTKLALKKGQLGFMTPFVWMFISSYEKLRIFLLEQMSLTSLIQLEYSAFEGAAVPICTFTIQNDNKNYFKSVFIKLSDFRGSANQAPKTLEAINDPDCVWRYETYQKYFLKIAGTPIAYWLPSSINKLFVSNNALGEQHPVRSGIRTGNDQVFIRLWFEIPIKNIQFRIKSYLEMKKRFFPMSKGGNFRKWSGNSLHVIDLENNGQRIISESVGDYALRNPKLYFQPYVTWSRISSGKISFRVLDGGVVFADAAPGIFAGENRYNVLGLVNSKFSSYIMDAINPSMNYQTGDIERIPYCEVNNETLIREIVILEKSDWDSYEISWDFENIPLLSLKHRSDNLEQTYQSLRSHWRGMTDEMLKLEEENNKIFIDAYGLQDELTPDVPIHEITLTCNPAYRYEQKVSKDVQEERLQQDTIKEFISYAVGCMFGRYALEEPGLILANQGETIEDYLKKVPNPSFEADDDNVIPILDEDWFDDDITERFKKFLRVTFGEEQFTENLRFIETSIGKPIRNYFLRDFYKDHVQTYKKRPIYWQFSSPKGSFNALIYMHRYNRDTVSVMLDQYLRQFKIKLSSQKQSLERTEISSDASQGEKTRAITQIQKVNTILQELEIWERDVIFPLATQRIDIDLDDGVKTNYPKFANALIKISGLS